MAIYRKKYLETSSAIFAIRANSQEEADKAFDDFFSDDSPEYNDFRDHMNEGGKDEIINLSTFDNEDAYNRSALIHDFFIDAGKSKEPLYDLYFIEDDKQSYLNKNMPLDDVLSVLRSFNTRYIMHPTCPHISARELMDARDRGVINITYKLERRN